jgi:hypothetical protein
MNLFPGNELPGYFQLSLRDMLNLMNSSPGNELPGYFQLSLRDRKTGRIPFPAMNCRAISIVPTGQKISPILSPI